MELNNNNNNESARSISELWINSIFKSLERLQQYEVNSRDGCSSIAEFLQVGNELIPQLRLKNFSLMLSEFDITLSNCMAILKEDEIKMFKDKLKFIQDIAEGRKKNQYGKPILISRFLKNSSIKQSQLILTYYFDIASKQLYKLREELVISLGHILFAKRDEFKSSNLQA